MSKTTAEDGDEPVPADSASSEAADPESEAPEASGPAAATAAKRRGSRSAVRWILAILCLLLTFALVATAVYSYQTISSTTKTLNETRLDLAREQSAHRSADAQVSGLSACVAALKADEASLTKVGNDLTAVQARTLKGGDIEAARLTYEAALLKALTDEHKAVVAASWASTPAEWTAVNTLGLQGENEMKQAAALKGQLDSLVTGYQGTADEVYAEGQAVAAQVSNTAVLCGFKPGSSVAPVAPGMSPSSNR